MRLAAGSVTIDLQAAQSPHYRDRGIARYAVDFTDAVLRQSGETVRQILVDGSLPQPEGLEPIRDRVTVTSDPDWSGPGGGIFHVMSPFELDVPLLRLWPREASRTRMKLVVTLYDLIPEVFPDLYLRDPGQRRRYRARREFVRAADHVFTLSRSAAADAVDLLGIAPDRISVVGAAAANRFRPPPDRTAALGRARVLIPGLSERFVVYNGAVEPRKNMEALVEAFAALPADLRSQWQLALVCRLRDSERNHLEVRAEQLGMRDRILLTGFVPDEQLVLLYQSAGLAVFPSLYEGYGLPVAEAMACGAPVIASATSSLPELVAPEATFDPRTPSSIALAMQRSLRPGTTREALVEWSSRPRVTWSEVAAKALDAYRRLLDGTCSPRGRWRERPRIALVTPWPPARTGVADYSRRLVERLDEHADVDVFVDGDSPVMPDRPAFLPPSLPLRDRAIGGYDAVVLALGNSEFHAGALRLLRVERIDAIVHAHEARLSGLYRHGEARGAVPEGLSSVLASMYPDTEAQLADSPDPWAVAFERGLLMAKEVVALSRKVLVSSEAAAAMIRGDCGPRDAEKVAIWPFAYPAARERDESNVDRRLICSAGLINAKKAPGLLIRAVAELRRRRPHTSLVLVGPVSNDVRAELEAVADEEGVREGVLITGSVPDDEYRAWLDRAAAAVQLRSASNGETSSAVADCLAHGVPVVVTSIGPQVELPDFVPKVPASAGPAEVADAIEVLLDGDEVRAEFAQASRRFVNEHSFEQAARRLIDFVPAWPSGLRK